MSVESVRKWAWFSRWREHKRSPGDRSFGHERSWWERMHWLLLIPNHLAWGHKLSKEEHDLWPA
jgi:hypothetical protein